MVLSGGGQLTRRQHLLSRDGRQLLVCTANGIRVYSTATAELLFDMQGHNDEVTCLCLHPKSSSQIYSSSKDGTIGLWDLQSGTRIQSWNVIGEPIESLVVVGSTAIVSCSWRQAQAGRALAFDLSKGAARESRIKLSKPRALAISANSNLVATHDRHTILVWATDSFGTAPPLALHHTKAITCVAISPDGGKVAAGDSTGRILIWHDVAATLAVRAAELAQQRQKQGAVAIDDDDEEEEAMDLIEPPAATVHWHAHAVGALSFSIDGAYLLSGGQEAVLVIWDVNSGRRAYLPRLGGPLVGIVGCPSDPSRYAIRQTDNSLRIINAAAMTVEASVHGIRPLPRSATDQTSAKSSSAAEKASLTQLSTFTTTAHASAPLVVEPSSGLAVVSGPHAMLQWYDFVRDCHVDKLQLSQRNIVSLTEGDAAALGGVYGPPAEPAATEVAFSRNGETMVTVESRPDPAGGGAVQYALKFWDKSAPSEATYGSPYRLNTLADQPHRSATGFGAVTALAFHPDTDLAATTSDIGEFKIWTRQNLRVAPKPNTNNKENSQQTTTTEKLSTWRCAAVGTHRNEPLTAAAFSSDGSVLALGSVTGGVSLWDATQTALLGVLPPALTRPSAASVPNAPMVRRLLFLANSPLLVALLNGGLAVYNLLTMRCEWAVEVAGVGRIVSDPISSHWAVTLSSPASPGAQHARGTSTTNAGSGVARSTSSKVSSSDQGIVMFRGAEESPVGAWRVSRAGPPGTLSIAFVPPATPLHVAAVEAGANVPGASPLVVLTADREYAVARKSGSSTGIAEGTAGLSTSGIGKDNVARAGGAGVGVSSFETLYGRSARVEQQQQEQGGGAAATVEVGGGGLGIGGRPPWAALFDAPSHALPPMGTLCPAFLELMVTGGGQSEDK